MKDPPTVQKKESDEQNKMISSNVEIKEDAQDIRVEKTDNLSEEINTSDHSETVNDGAVKKIIQGPIGLDIGTTNIVMTQKNKTEMETSLLVNAFFSIPYSNFAKESLLKDEIDFFKKDETLYILGESADRFANIFNSPLRRPIEGGILNPKEKEGENIIKAIIKILVQTPKKKGETVCFSVPGRPIDEPDSVLIYHESIIKSYLIDQGYIPVSINEGLAVVLSELASNNYSGIGISLGGGMCNVCFSYLSVPVLTYSLRKGGDYIDTMVSQSVGEPLSEIKKVKEKDLDLSIEPRNRIETGLHIFYDALFSALAQSLEKSIGSSENIPRIAKPLPIVLGGGTVLPKGSCERFQKNLENVRLSVKISDVICAERPLYATAKGALMMALL